MAIVIFAQSLIISEIFANKLIKCSLTLKNGGQYQEVVESDFVIRLKMFIYYVNFSDFWLPANIQTGVITIGKPAKQICLFKTK